MFTMQEPYYGIILSSMERVPMPASRIETVAVTRSGNVFRLIYNPQFVTSIDVPTALEILKHEIGHLCFNHFTLWKDNPKSRGEQHLRNIATDLEVNSYINRNNVHGIQLHYPEDYDWDKGLGTREYYRLLLEMLDNQKATASQTVQKPCNGGKGGNDEDNSNDSEEEKENQNEGSGSNSSNAKQNGSQEDGEDEAEDESMDREGTDSGGNKGDKSNSPNEGTDNAGGVSSQSVEIPDDALEDMKEFDDHSMWPNEEEEEGKDTVNQIIEDMLIAAAEEVEKNGHGDIPGEMKGKIAEIRNRRKPKPAADWKRYVRRYLGNEFSEFIRKSKKRESRRFPDAAGNRHRRKSNILVAIDTSGSVSMPEYIEFFGQIRTLTSVASFDVVECDAAIQKTYHFNNKPNMEIHGGGGTSYEPVVDMFIANQKKYDALIYFTDGECWVPSNTPKDTLWVISSRGDKRRTNEFRVNGSSVVFIPKKEQ